MQVFCVGRWLGTVRGVAGVGLAFSLAAHGGCMRKAKAPPREAAAPPAGAPVSPDEQRGHAGPGDPGLLRQRQQFRAEQDSRMRGELSPLARVAYIHLPPGDHTVGSGSTAAVRLAATASGGLGETAELRLRVEAQGPLRQLWLHAAPAILRNRVAETEARLQSGDVLTAGRLRLLITGLPEDPAVAIYDPATKARTDYAGLHYFPDDERFVVRGKLERYAEPRAVRLEASRGEPRPLQAVGTLRFTVAGQAASMEAYSESPDGAAPLHLFLIFKDRTNGEPEGSYGAGRFLSTGVGASDEVLLDFNQAWNPLCAYSQYFHCPLPPRSNWLPFPIPVGERSYGNH